MIEPHDETVILEVSEGDTSTGTMFTWRYANQDHNAPHLDINGVDTSITMDAVGGQLRIIVTGKTFKYLRQYDTNLLDKVIMRGVVFARMAPEQKQQLIELLQSMNYYVSMCGDGANDCGTLKAAHAGVSLSQTEASVASPFTSKRNDISCIPTLIREGRSSLVTAFGIVKYMASYSLCQFFSVTLLYTVSINILEFLVLLTQTFLQMDVCKFERFSITLRGLIPHFSFFIL